MLQPSSVTCPLSCDGIVQGTELCDGLGLQFKATPLHEAAAYGHSESVQLLLTAKGSANAENDVSDSCCKSDGAVWC